MEINDKHKGLVDAIKCVIESNDYMDIYAVNIGYPKHSLCTHGNHVYEGCENCISNYLDEALFKYG